MRDGIRFERLTAITFDVGGTLMRPHPSVGAVYREIAAQYGCDYDADALERGFRAAFRNEAPNPQLLAAGARERDRWYRIVRATLRATDASPPQDFDAFFEELWETFARGSRWRLFPHVSATLAALRARGFRLGVVSNWDQRLHSVLEETGLRPLFDAVVISSEVGAEKPAIEIFRTAENAFQATPLRCLHIGDSRQHDLDGARAAGWNALLVRNDAEACAADEINGLEALLEILPQRLVS